MITLEVGTGGVSRVGRTKKNAGVGVKTPMVKKAGLKNSLPATIATICARNTWMDALNMTKIAKRMLNINQRGNCVRDD